MFGIVLSSIAALSLLAVGFYAVLNKRTAVNAILLFTAVLLAGMEIGDQLSLQLSADFETFRRLALFLEALLPASFLALSFIYNRSESFDALSKGRIGLLVVSLAAPITLWIAAGREFYYSPDFPGEAVLFLGSAGYWYYISSRTSSPGRRRSSA